jgi:hypothetical protein
MLQKQALCHHFHTQISSLNHIGNFLELSHSLYLCVVPMFNKSNHISSHNIIASLHKGCFQVNTHRERCEGLFPSLKVFSNQQSWVMIGNLSADLFVLMLFLICANLVVVKLGLIFPSNYLFKSKI